MKIVQILVFVSTVSSVAHGNEYSNSKFLVTQTSTADVPKVTPVAVSRSTAGASASTKCSSADMARSASDCTFHRYLSDVNEEEIEDDIEAAKKAKKFIHKVGLVADKELEEALDGSDDDEVADAVELQSAAQREEMEMDKEIEKDEKEEERIYDKEIEEIEDAEDGENEEEEEEDVASAKTSKKSSKNTLTKSETEEEEENTTVPTKKPEKKPKAEESEYEQLEEAKELKEDEEDEDEDEAENGDESEGDEENAK